MSIFIKVASVFTFDLAFSLLKVHPIAVLEHVQNGEFIKLFTVPLF